LSASNRWECHRDAQSCGLSLGHSMRGSCQPNELVAPLTLAVPYGPNKTLDNLVFEILDRSHVNNPTSLLVKLYSGQGTHEALLDTTPQQTTSRSRQRVFSLGLNAIQMPDLLCGGPCNNAGVGYVSLVVQCQEEAVKFSVLPSSITHALSMNEPIHGEACPELWTFHRLDMQDVRRIRFTIHVHQGDIYYAMARWTHLPGFAACNVNEMLMSGKTEGSVDLCETNATVESNVGYVALYGGTSCAMYTITAQPLADDLPCKTTTTGICSDAYTSAAAASVHSLGMRMPLLLAVLSAAAVAWR